jgi:hypothetical protein
MQELRGKTRLEIFRAMKREFALLNDLGKLKDPTNKPLPTFEEQVAKAGGKLVPVPKVLTVADWHELDY